MKRYNKVEINEKWNEIKQEPDFIFRNGAPIFNYISRLKEEDILYSEYISQLILRDFSVLESIGKNDKIIRKTKSFNRSHTGISDDRCRQMRFGYLRFNEKPFSIALFNSRKEYPFGKIIDYQVPLSEKRSPNIGVVDLIGKDGKKIFVIELKAKSKETLLRTVIEVFTFVIFLNARREKLCRDFHLPTEIKLIPTVLTFEAPYCEEQLKAMGRGELPSLKKLLTAMNRYLGSLGIDHLLFFEFNISEIVLAKNELGRTVILNNNIHYDDVQEQSP